MCLPTMEQQEKFFFLKRQKIETKLKTKWTTSQSLRSLRS
jgi:hypothetical protein